MRPLIDEEVWTDAISYSQRDADTGLLLGMKSEMKLSEERTRFAALHSSSLRMQNTDNTVFMV